MAQPPDSGAKPPPQATGSSATSWADVGIGVLNGVVGDYLHARSNGLAVKLSVVHAGAPIDLDRPSLEKVYANASSKLCVFAHGLCCTEASWEFPEASPRTYGAMMSRDFGITPLFIRYNSGLHISENGRQYCETLQGILDHWPVEVEELSLVGHSMGGLISRSACLYADRLGRSWLGKLRRAVYLGSPHLGAPLEKLGNVAAAMLGSIPDPIAHLARDLINLRSIGIKDLRYANLVDEDWVGRDPDAVLVNARTHTPLLEGIEHYVVAGTLTRQENHVLAQMVGDALVRLESATGRPNRGSGGLGLPDEHVARFPGFHHMMLAHHPEVYARLRSWFSR